MIDGLTYKIRTVIYRARILIYNRRLAYHEYLLNGIHEIQIAKRRLKGVSPDFANAVGNLYGIDVPKDRDLGIAMLEEIFDKTNDPEASAFLGFLYINEFDDPISSLKWFSRTVEAGGWWANYKLGILLSKYDFETSYLASMSIESDAEIHFQRGFQFGNIPSKIRLLEQFHKSGEISLISLYSQKTFLVLFSLFFIFKNVDDYRIRMY